MALLSEVQKNYGKLKNYVNGEWVDSQTDKFLDVENPSTGEIIAQMPLSTVDETKAAVETAQEAWMEWRETPPISRARIFFKLKELLEQNFESIARIMTQEMGKTIDEARGETRRAIENVEVASGIPSLMFGYNLEDGAAEGIDEDAVISPLGVFAAVCPFNFPAMIPYWFWPYAVATGNSYIVKPSSQVPITQNFMFRMVAQAGFPPGVINLVNGSHEVSDTLMEHPKVKGISFVGSTPVAKYIYKKSAENGKRVQAQGGAKNSLVVMPDCKMDRAVANMLASFYGCAGQRCLAGSNLVLVGDVAEPFMKKFVEASGKIRVGYGLDESINMGPVISAKSKKKVLGYIDGAVNDGAKPLLDGRGIKVPGYEKGHFVGPTILDGCTPDMATAKDEIFGPVVSVLRMKSLDEAIDFINSSPFGNAASIYTQNGRSARDFRYKLQVGNIGVNVGIVAAMAYFPFAGYKDSFFGDLHGQGKDAINFFTDRKVVITRWF
ncbi:MAG: CoA-acylating methylmalonate-semialdehyde dehydrogenase [Candidatus Thermoplasmatota archaeon]|nr:CoA-acylating methylmalonate-semialdehyde dehydrogenase [Candidatus Thermoplasmatota archaeon]